MDEIYFDNAATTAVDADVAQLACKVMCEQYGNASSLHSKGVEAQLLMERAQKQVLTALGAKSGKVIFTSGGTEANNLAIFGGASAKKRRGNRVITTTIEHSSVIDSARELKKQGFDVIEIAPEQNGVISAEKLLSFCNEDTILVSVMAANNEIGTIQPIEKIAKSLKRLSPNALMHVDAVQAFGKMPLSVSALGVDLMTVSGHKIHAPKGIGALYIADKVKIDPRQFGGGQQGKIRPGTESVPLIAALGLAAQNAHKNLAENAAKAAAAKAELLSLLNEIEGITINSPGENCLPYVLNCSVLGYRSETLLHFLEAQKIYVSSGSACSMGAKSHVLAAMGKTPAEIDSALRISFSKYSTAEQAQFFAQQIKSAMSTLRRAR
ncbi:MAG: cysteine desulfurase [Oscillospiraceae bacterium]|nr:cysteine desulfurase [Oscillospiraceae bacterium]